MNISIKIFDNYHQICQHPCRIIFCAQMKKANILKLLHMSIFQALRHIIIIIIRLWSN